MEITVSVAGREGFRKMEVSETATPLEVVKELGFYPDEIMVLSKTRSEKPIPIDGKLSPGEKLIIVPVASGG